MDEYLDSVREVERRIQQAEQQAAESPLPALERPASVPADWEDHVKLMFDLQVLALQADMTRVITFQLAREGSTRTYPQIGVPEPHHPVSHHTNDPEKLAKLAKINAYHVSLFAYLLEKLQVDAGRRRHAARSHDLPARQRHGQSGYPRSSEPADRRRARRHRRRQGRRITSSTGLTPLANLHLTLLDTWACISIASSTARAAPVRSAEPLSL